MSEQYCDQCQNHCPADALRCNRGRAHFGLKTEEPKMPEGAVGLLQRCGFVLHHGNIGADEALSSLNSQEQAELERLLSVLLEDWQKRMPEGMPKGMSGHHHHGHH